MFTFTLTADSVEELQDLILEAAQKISGPPVFEETTLDDFSLQDIAEHLRAKGFELK